MPTTHRKDKSIPPEKYKMSFKANNWMSHLDPTTPVIDSYIPASHDSSAYPIPQDRANTNQTNLNHGSVTQSVSYLGQLTLGGIRYFDMRLRWANGGYITTHHGPDYFTPFHNVLDEIKYFFDDNPTETIFIDLDFTTDLFGFHNDLSNKVMAMLLQKLGAERFTSKHVTTVGGGQTFNTSLTWGDLAQEAKAGRNIAIMWPGGEWALDSPPAWAPTRENIREDPFSDFNLKSVDEIITYLTKELAKKTKSKLFVTQLVNTPGLSFVVPPVVRDEQAAPVFNEWMMKNLDRLNVVKRDFVISDWNIKILDQALRVRNKYVTPLEHRFVEPFVKFQQWVRLRDIKTGHYVAVQTANKTPTPLAYLHLVDQPTLATNFNLTEWTWRSTEPLRYTGEFDRTADTECPGNLRLIFKHPTDRGMDFVSVVVSHSPSHNNLLYWGQASGPANDLETFYAAQANKMLGKDEVVYKSSSPFMLRTKWNQYWTTGSIPGTRDVGLYANCNDWTKATVFNFVEGEDPATRANL
ncbi:PLC-like phosphodiesterase [Meredithblackwellia eburnea MCA 4105]